MKVVIMAGGKGTRIAVVNSEVPKPMITILDKPILEYQIECLKKQGYKDLIITVGHLGKCIREYFQNGARFGVNIDYIEENEPLGTAGALYYLKDKLREDFLLINGDIIFDVDIKRFLSYHKKNKGIVTILTHPNDHPYDSGIIVADYDGLVIQWLSKEDNRQWYQNRVNAGMHICSPKIFEYFSELKKVDLDRDILKKLVLSRKLVAYDSPEYIKDMGTPERYYEVINDIASKKVYKKNLFHKQKAIFIDRDGTINKYVGFLNNIDNFELLEGVAEAICKINHSDYLAIVITNQPVIARGEVTINELQEIHNKMETLLGEKGAYLDAIYYCPHHQDKGFEGERLEYKVVCECRKPKPGLIYQARDKFNIDLAESYMIGDEQTDILTGIAAGCKTYYVGEKKIEQFGTVSKANLLEAVIDILPNNS